MFEPTDEFQTQSNVDLTSHVSASADHSQFAADSQKGNVVPSASIVRRRSLRPARDAFAEVRQKSTCRQKEQAGSTRCEAIAEFRSDSWLRSQVSPAVCMGFPGFREQPRNLFPTSSHSLYRTK